ncbi:hypothetical protein DAI22_04g009950 [Oryza sativa Japonica Group]|nr:hypothetical protein DAI22_04g009950 [Oryza sativa Japonica Group]
MVTAPYNWLCGFHLILPLCSGIETWTKECTNRGLIIGKRKYRCLFFLLRLFSSELHEDLGKKKKMLQVFGLNN